VQIIVDPVLIVINYYSNSPYRIETSPPFIAAFFGPLGGPRPCADSILPVICICKTPPGPSDYRRFDLLESLDDIIADSTGIRNRTILADPDAIVDTMT
jgi:hypothetical protein